MKPRKYQQRGTVRNNINDYLTGNRTGVPSYDAREWTTSNAEKDRIAYEKALQGDMSGMRQTPMNEVALDYVITPALLTGAGYAAAPGTGIVGQFLTPNQYLRWTGANIHRTFAGEGAKEVLTGVGGLGLSGLVGWATADTYDTMKNAYDVGGLDPVLNAKWKEELGEDWDYFAQMVPDERDVYYLLRDAMNQGFTESPQNAARYLKLSEDALYPALDRVLYQNYGDYYDQVLEDFYTENPMARPETPLSDPNDIMGFIRDLDISPNKYEQGGQVSPSNYYPTANFISRQTNIPLDELYDYAYYVANHETGGTFDPQQKALSGGPDSGLYQMIPDALPTLSKRALAIYAAQEMEPPSYLSDIINGKITSALDLDLKQQTDLFFAGLTYLDDSGNPQIYDVVTANPLSNVYHAADVWMETHNKASDIAARTSRMEKFLSDNKDIEPEKIFKSGGSVGKYQNGNIVASLVRLLRSGNKSSVNWARKVLGQAKGLPQEAKLIQANPHDFTQIWVNHPRRLENMKNYGYGSINDISKISNEANEDLTRVSEKFVPPEEMRAVIKTDGQEKEIFSWGKSDNVGKVNKINLSVPDESVDAVKVHEMGHQDLLNKLIFDQGSAREFIDIIKKNENLNPDVKKDLIKSFDTFYDAAGRKLDEIVSPAVPPGTAGPGDPGAPPLKILDVLQGEYDVLLNKMESVLDYESLPWEVKSNIHTLRYLMRDNRVKDILSYDFDGFNKFNLQLLESLMRTNNNEAGLNQLYKLRKNYSEEDIIEMLNDLTDVSDSSGAAQTAQYGKIVQKAQNGGITDYPYSPYTPLIKGDVNPIMPHQYQLGSIVKLGKKLINAVRKGSKNADELVESITSHEEMMKSYKPKTKIARKVDDIAHRLNLHGEYLDYVDSNNENLQNYLNSLTISTRNKFPLQTQIENTIDYGNHRVKNFGKNLYEPDFDINANYADQMNDLDDTYTDIYNRIAEAEKWDIPGAVRNLSNRARYMRDWVNKNYPSISNEDWIRKYGQDSEDYPLEMTYLGQHIDRLHNQYDNWGWASKDANFRVKDLDDIHENFDKYNSTLRAMMPEEIYTKMMSDAYKELGPAMPFQEGGPVLWKKTKLSPEEEAAFLLWADNEDPDDYDLRGFYQAEKDAQKLKPAMQDYFKENPDFHFYSIGRDGKILKSDKHQTRGMTMMTEELLGNQVYLTDDGLYSRPRPDQYQSKGEVDKDDYDPYQNTLYVSDPDDPRLKSYQDSLYNYNVGQNMLNIMRGVDGYIEIPLDSKYAQAANKYKDELNDNTSLDANPDYPESVQLSYLMDQYQQHGNRSILPEHIQPFIPDPDQGVIDLINGRDMLEMLGMKKERFFGNYHLPVWKKPERQVKTKDQRVWKTQMGGVPKAQYGDNFDGGVPEYGDYARDAGDYYMRYIDSPKFARRADNFGYNYRQYGPGRSGEPIEGVTGKPHTPTIEDVRAEYKNTHTNPRINPLTVNVTNDPNQPTTASYTEGFGANHIGGNYNPNDSNLSAQDLMAHEMAHSFQYGEQDFIISQGNDPNALSGEKLERQYVIDRLTDEGFEKIPKDWRSEVLKSTINPNLRNSSMAETATSYSGFMPAAPGAHDIDFREVKADIWALRKKAYDMGIYDDINDSKFEKEHLQKMQEADPENLMINRIIENFGEDSLIDFMNELVDTGNGSQVATTAQYGGTMNTMGYRDDSPYKHLPAIPIEGNNITMDNVSMPLLLIPNAGQAQVAPPNSGHYQFPGASRVLEIPLQKSGGSVKKGSYGWTL